MEEFVRKNPWLGLESYKEGEVLYGRDDDIRDLTQCVLNDTDTLLYGKSGIGKSSILNAGILPAARRSGYLPVLIRLSHKEKHSYLYQINQAIFNAILHSPATELRTDVYITNGDMVLNETQSLIREVVPCKDTEDESFYEYFHRHTFYSANGKRLKLLIIFDQFEEIFTLQDDVPKKKNFFTHLADLLNDIMPDELQQNVEISSDTQEEIIVGGESDFENIFDDLNLGVENNLPEYVTDNDIHFVFTIREDFLSEFEYYSAAIPSLKQNRYGLRPINEEQAAQIILRPIPELIDESVAKLIIEEITGKKDFKIDGVPEIEVDSAVLSLYLNRLYEAKEGKTITKKLVEQKGGEIISDFYNDALSEISDSTIEYLENMLLNGQGRRDNITVYDAINDGNISEQELDILYNKKKILRQFNYANELRIEYVHDILCPVVKEHKLQREQERRIKATQEKYLRYKRTTLRVFLVFLGIIALVLFDYSMSHVTKPRTITGPINAESFGSRNIFHESHAENGELFIHGRYTTIWGDMNLKKIVFTDTTFVSNGKFIAPKLEEVLFRKGFFVLSTQTFSNAPHIVTIMDSVQRIDNNGTICFSTKPIEYNIGNNENFKILHSDILLSKDHEDNEWDIIFAGNQDKSSPIVIPYNIKLNDRHTNLKIRIAKQLELDSINHEMLNDEEYYYLVNTNSKDTIAPTYLNYFRNLTYANITDTKIIKRFSLYNVKEATFPHAKELWCIECPKLRRLELPNIEKIESNAVDCETLAELFLPTRLCTSKDTLQQNLFRWGIGKLITQIIPQNDSTSLVRLDNTFLISPETEFPNDTLLNCPYDKVKLRIPSHINNIAYNAFDGAANLEDLSVDINNKEFFSYGNAVYQHGKYLVKGYAPNASEIYLLNWSLIKTLRLGDNVRKIYTFFPETMYNNNIIGNCLNNVTLYVPKPKLKAATITLGNVFGEIKPLNTYQILFIDLSFIIKRLFCEYHILLTVAFIMLISALLFRKTRQYALCLCIVYPFCHICYHSAYMILGFRQYNTFIPLCLALVFTFLIVKKLLNKTETEVN